MDQEEIITSLNTALKIVNACKELGTPIVKAYLESLEKDCLSDNDITNLYFSRDPESYFQPK